VVDGRRVQAEQEGDLVRAERVAVVCAIDDVSEALRGAAVGRGNPDRPGCTLVAFI
jgi:hypothetical protein